MNPVVEFKPVDPQGPGVVAELGDGFFTPTVDGGWQVVAREGKVGITEYQGGSPVTMDIPILFDGFATDASVTHLVDSLYQIMRKKVGKRDEPAVIELRQFPAPYRGLRWVITGINPGDEIRRAKDGLITRKALTVTVMEYVPGDITVVSKKQSPAQKVASQWKVKF